jgi:3-isopropylmalate/(R)-2-methylmalate dehydratase small subunit
MQPFTEVTGAAAPLLRANIDTDVIIRIERLTSIPREQLGRYALEALRYAKDGSENPDFVLNQPAFRAAPILIAGANFGCGSSREGAVWALMATGLRCVIAESFGDIFYNNCFQNGMLPVVLAEPAIKQLVAQTGQGQSLTVDLALQRIRLPDGTVIPFEIDGARRQSLLEGLDEIGRTLRQTSDIVAWQQKDRAARSWVWRLPAA